MLKVYFFIISIIFIGLALFIHGDQALQRKKLNVLVLIENHHFYSRSLQICVSNEVKAINSGKWSFLNDFYLDAQTKSIDKKYSDIMDTLCDMLNMKTNTIIVINFFDNSELGTLNNQLFLKFANYLNIPVIVFNPISYQTVSKTEQKQRDLNLFLKLITFL